MPGCRSTSDASFGLIAGKSLALVRYGFLPPLALFSPSLRQIPDDIVRFAPLVLNRSEIDLNDGGPHARLLITPVMQGGRSGRFRAEFVAISALQLLRLSRRGRQRHPSCGLPLHLPDDQHSRYVASFGAGLRFDQKPWPSASTLACSHRTSRASSKSPQRWVLPPCPAFIGPFGAGRV